MAVKKPALLAIAPPYQRLSPPAGAAALLGYLRHVGCNDFAFLDMRLGTSEIYAPTYTHTGVKGDSYVMDVPDLPLVLEVIESHLSGKAYVPCSVASFDRYCLERGISSRRLREYVLALSRYVALIVQQLKHVHFVGFTCWTSNYLATLIAAYWLKRLPHPPVIVLGGPQVTESAASAELALSSRLADCVIYGEGEASLANAYAVFCERGPDLTGSLPGTVELTGTPGKTQRTPRPLLRLSELPPPAFDQMIWTSYQSEPGYVTFPAQLSRGCTDKCTFCSEWVFWERYRSSPSEKIVDELLHLQRRYGANSFIFTDSLLNGHPRRLIAFAEELLRRGVDIYWGGFMRAQMDAETARLLQRAGCAEAFVGIESFSDETLALMNKRRTEADNITALRTFLDAGVFITAGLIPGFPGDSREGFIHTIEIMKSLQAEFPRLLAVNVEPFTASPGQPLFQDLESVGLQCEQWDEVFQDICPAMKAVSRRITCAVKGSCQGSDRTSRYSMAMSISDESAKSSMFQYTVEEETTQDEFELEYLDQGVHFARLKLYNGTILGLLVSDAELRDLSHWQHERPLSSCTPQQIGRKLAPLLARHTAHACMQPVAVSQAVSARNAVESGVLSISPYAVIRGFTRRGARRVFYADVASGLAASLSASYEPILRFVATRRHPVPLEDLLRRYTRVDRGRVRARLAQLLRQGILLQKVSANLEKQKAGRKAKALMPALQKVELIQI